ncbi:tetratricopeptide repeat protein [Streptomyces sp. NPDC002817]|uniref:tetratricopeptide repeat protein n=1 Tax=Streptomyces sp. NPDC088357 TaxID=3154655 RepID=UPI00342FA8B5
MTPASAPERTAALASAASIAVETVTGTQWPVRLAEALRDLDATWQESAEVCADVAWQARATGTSALVLLTPEHVTAHGPGPGPVVARTYRHLYLSALRYDFRCRSIESLLNQVPLSVLDADPYSWALYAFARLGQSRSDGLAVMEQVLAATPDHPKTLHVLLHGVWLGGLLPGRADTLLALVDRLPDGGDGDPIAQFRKASALRALGHYPQAHAAIERALELLPPGQPAVHADLVREHTLITAAFDLIQLAPQGRKPDSR